MGVTPISSSLAEGFASFIDRWSGWLWDTGWQGGIVGALALLIAIGLRRRPQLAYGLILLALLKFLLPPLVPAPQSLRQTSPLVATSGVPPSPRQDSAHPPASAEPNGWAAWLRDEPGSATSWPDDMEAAANHASGQSEAGSKDALEATAAGAPATSRWRWRTIGLVMYFTGLCAASSWIGISWLRVRRLVAASSPPDARLERIWQQTRRQVHPGREVRLLVTERPVAPLAFGLLRPVVVLPRELLASLGADQQRMVLAHELLHHRRRDPWGILLELCVIALWWFHPVAWLLVLASRSLRERCCDEATVRVLDQPAIVYARVLEAVARWLAGSRAAFPLMSATMHPIGVRIRHLLHPLWEARPMKRRTVLWLLVLWALFCLPTLHTSHGPNAAAAAGDEPQVAERPEQPNAGSAAENASEVAVPAGAAAVDRYGDPLPEGAVARLGTARLRHMAHVTGVAFSPDGGILATAGAEGLIRFWHPLTGKLVRELTGSVYRITYAMAFAPDGTKLATAGDEGLVRLWDVASGKEIWEAQRHAGRAAAVVFFPDGAGFATGGVDGTVRIWDAETGDELLVLSPGRVRDGYALAISPDGSRLACGGLQDIVLYNLETGEELRRIERAHGADIFSLAFTGDGHQLASGGHSLIAAADGQGGEMLRSLAEIRLWNAEDGALVRRFATDASDAGGSIALDSEGRFLISRHPDKLRIWDPASGELIRTIHEYRNHFWQAPQTLALSPDRTFAKTLLAVTEGYHEVMLWDLETGERHLHFDDAHSAVVSSVAASADATVIASGAGDGILHLWNASRGELTQRLSISTQHEPLSLRSLAFSADGMFLAAVGSERASTGIAGAVNVSTVDGKPLWSTSLEATATRVAFSTDGQFLAIASGDGWSGMSGMAYGAQQNQWNATIYSATTGELRRRLSGFKEILALEFAPEAESLRIVDSHTVSSWNTATGEQDHEFSPSAHERPVIRGAAIAPNGKTIATSSLSDNLIILWDATSGQELRRIESDDGARARLFAFSADGTRLASASSKLIDSVHIWDVSTGDPVGKISSPGLAWVTSLAFMPEGTQLLTGMADGTVLVRDLTGLAPPR